MRNLSKLRMPVLVMGLAVGLLSQAPPPKIAKKTPLPGVPARAAQAPGAYQTPDDGSVVLPNGEVLVQATPGGNAREAPARHALEPRLPSAAPDEASRTSAYITQEEAQPEREARAAAIGGAKHRAQADESMKEQDSMLRSMMEKAAAGSAPAPGPAGAIANAPVVDPRGDLAKYTRDTVTAPELAAQKGLALIEAGRIISLRSITGANTQLGGHIVAQVERDVHDLQGRFVVIPAGSKVIGLVRTISDQGQTRAALIFSQIVRPDGEQIPLFVNAPAGDAQGRAGVGGKMNRRWPLKLGTAVVYGTIMGAIAPRNAANAGGFSMFGGGNQQQLSVNDIVRQNVSQQFSQVGQKQVQQTFEIPPEIDIPMNKAMTLTLPGTVYVRPWKRRLPY